MKNIVSVLAVFLLVAVSSCHRGLGSGRADAPDSLCVCDSVLSRYVMCSDSVVARLIAIGDSVYARTSDYTIEDLGFYDEDQNEYLRSSYGDTIPAIVSIYDSYHRITSYADVDEASAAFVWHEVARAQIACFLQSEERAGVYKFMDTIEGFICHFDSGTQRELTTAAYRKVMVADYRLIDAYKCLMDSYPTPEVKDLALRDYLFVHETSRDFFERRFEQASYSDLSRELMCIYYSILMSKAESVNRLIAARADSAEVMRNLREHSCFVEGKEIKFAKDVISRNYSCD